MIRILLALYPKEWRRIYGNEFAALLEDSHLTIAAVLNVIVQAMKLNVKAHHRAAWVGAAAVISACLEIVSRATGTTTNILWTPTSPIRVVLLLVLFTPWIALVVGATHRRKQRESVW